MGHDVAKRVYPLAGLRALYHQPQLSEPLHQGHYIATAIQPAHDLTQQTSRELQANDRSAAKQVLQVSGQPVHARHHQAAQRCRYLKLPQRNGRRHLPPPLKQGQYLLLDQDAHKLFNIKGVALGARQNRADQWFWQSLQVHQVGQERAAVLRRQGRQL